MMSRIVCLAIILVCFSCDSNKGSNETLAVNEILESVKGYYENDNYDKVIDVINNSDLDSLPPELFFKRGFSFMQIDKFDSAQFDFQKSAELGYEQAKSYYNLSLINMYFMNDSLAKKYAELALLIDPKYEKAKDVLNSYK